MEVLPQYCKEAVKRDNFLASQKSHCGTQKLVKKLHCNFMLSFQVGSEFPLITNLEMVRRLNKIGRDSPGFVDIKFPWKEVWLYQ